MFTRCSSEAVTFHQTQQEILWKNLSLVDTHDDILQAIKFGVLSLETDRDDVEPIQFSPLLTSAAYEQQTMLGWGSFLCGRISTKWQVAYAGGQESSGKSSL